MNEIEAGVGGVNQPNEEALIENATEDENERIYYQVGEEHMEQEIIEFLCKSFTNQEPLSMVAGITDEDSKSIYNAHVRECLQEPVSLIARNSAQEIVGVRLSSIVNLPLRSKECEEARGNLTENAWKLESFLAELEKDFDKNDMIQKLSPTKLLKFFILCVREDYYRRGIALKLIDSSVKNAQKIGCKGVILDATSSKSQKLYESKLNYHVLKTFLFSHHVDPNGSPYLKNEIPGETCGKLMFQEFL
eukprot:Sdes_comp21968_c0_seq1m20512